MELNFDSKDFLPGVYNYCDRWCERCLYNSRCMVYATEIEVKENLPENKKDDDFEYIKVIFENLMNLLGDFAEKEGIDLNSEQSEEEHEFEIDKIREEVSELPLMRSSMRYTEEAHLWLKKNNEKLKKLFEGIKFNFDKKKSKETQLDELLKIKDTIEIISQYSAFIHVKLFRAHSNEIGGNLDGDFEKTDTLISSKLALIGLERSIFAWEVLLKLLHLEDDSISQILVNLRRIKIETEMRFPEAKDFKRPYFDE